MRIYGAQISRRNNQTLWSMDRMAEQPQAQKRCAAKRTPPSLPHVKT
jgi:hypothetical protein